MIGSICLSFHDLLTPLDTLAWEPEQRQVFTKRWLSFSRSYILIERHGPKQPRRRRDAPRWNPGAMWMRAGSLIDLQATKKTVTSNPPFILKFKRKKLSAAEARARFDGTTLQYHTWPSTDEKSSPHYLSKAMSSLLVQIRTGKIGLRAFLFKRRVPEVTTPYCRCGLARETFEHIVLEVGKRKTHGYGETKRGRQTSNNSTTNSRPWRGRNESFAGLCDWDGCRSTSWQ